MKFLDKLGLVIFSIIILILSISLMLVGFNLMDPNVFSVLLSKILMAQNTTYIMVGICILLILLSLRCLFFVDYEKTKKSEKGILMQNNDGKLLITRSTLENLVQGVIKEFPSVDSSEIDVIIDKEDNVLIDVTLNIKEGVIIKDLSSKLQSKIKKTVKEATDLELKTVDIEIRRVEVKEQTNEDI